MTRSDRWATAAVALLITSGVLTASAQSRRGDRRRPARGGGSSPSSPGGGGSRVPAGLGQPVAGLDAEQQSLYAAGREAFAAVKGIEDGLGPVFNGRSCGECHGAPVLGGMGQDLEQTSVVRVGRLQNGVFDELTSLGGSLLQRRSIRELDPTCPITGEQVPAEANVVSFRASPAVFGLGLMEAIPETTIEQGADPDDRNRDGISGRVNHVFNPETGRTEAGRFGWKAPVPTVDVFSAGALNFELGITNPLLPGENLPQGRPIPDGWDRVPDAEDGGQMVRLLSTFMRYIAPPAAERLSPQGRRGEQLFAGTGCAACHTPSMQSGGSDPALANRRAGLYSDLLLHDMGPELADGVTMGEATGSEWRTTPLWGLRFRRYFLHDGRAKSLDEAVRLHGGEGQGAAARFGALNRTDRQALLEFLRSL